MRRLTILDEVLLHEESGEAFLLHVATGRYFGLNRAGVVVWNAIVEGSDPVTVLSATWPQRDAAELAQDANTLIDGLVAAGLVRVDFD